MKRRTVGSMKSTEQCHLRALLQREIEKCFFSLYRTRIALSNTLEQTVEPACYSWTGNQKSGQL